MAEGNEEKVCKDSFNVDYLGNARISIVYTSKESIASMTSAFCAKHLLNRRRQTELRDTTLDLHCLSLSS